MKSTQNPLVSITDDGMHTERVDRASRLRYNQNSNLSSNAKVMPEPKARGIRLRKVLGSMGSDL